MNSSLLRHCVPAAMLALITACGGGSDDSGPPPPPPPPVPTASLAAAPVSASVQAGSNTTSTITLTRGGGFAGAVVIAATGAPAGVTVTGGTMAAGATTQAVTIATTGAAAAGTTNLSITGTAAGVTITPLTFALTVTAAPPVGASVTLAAPAGALLMEGSTVPLTATVRDAGGTVIAGSTVTWSSSNTSLATVSDAGVVSGLAGGVVTITATSGGVNGTLALRVAKDITSFVSQVRTDRGLPAMGGAVVTRDGIVAIGVAGNRRISGGGAVTIADKWHIGSNLKALTATLAAVAVKEGKISWDSKVVDAFPELAGTIRAEYLTVTLRDLLAMRSGLDGNPPSNAYGGGTTARGQREWGAGWVLARAPVVTKGNYFYSNLAFVTSGAMLERAIGGGNFEDLFVTKLAQPSGALGVGWGPADAAGSNPAGHTRSGGNWVVCANCDNPPGLSAAGRAHMPLADWARIIGEILKGDAGQSTVLDQTALRETLTGHTAMGGADQYGLGWVVTTRPWGGRTVTHAGSNTSNHSVTWVGLDTGVAFLAVTNASDNTAGTTNTGNAMDALVERMLNWYRTGI